MDYPDHVDYVADLHGHPDWDEFGYLYHAQLAYLLKNKPDGWDVKRAGNYNDSGHHPADGTLHECLFAAEHLRNIRPQNILDIGSYRHFLAGLLACGYDVTELEVRRIHSHTVPGETKLVGDAKSIPADDEQFDCVVTMCSLEHFGLGRYGDEFDLDGDTKAMDEIWRVLKLGGHLIITTTVAKTPVIWFNAHRVYTHEMIMDFASGFEVLEEKVYNEQYRHFWPVEKCVEEGFDYYCGLWRKVAE